MKRHPQFSKDMLGTLWISTGGDSDRWPRDIVTENAQEPQLYKTLAIPIDGPIFHLRMGSSFHLWPTIKLVES